MPSDVTTTNGTPELANSLRALGLWLLADELDDFIARSTKSRSSARQVLEELARLELQERARKSVERRLRRSRVGRFKAMAGFDWEWPQKIDRGAVERVLTMGFIERAENVLLVASQGLGKTMMAKNLVQLAAQRGANAVFTTASDLLLDLSKQETARGLERRLRYYSQPQVLAIDEVGYLSYDNHAADLLFQIVSRRYERRSIILTTNLAFSEWNTVFPNAACATALIDRLTHHAEIVTMTGESYRKREAELAQKARRRGN